MLQTHGRTDNVKTVYDTCKDSELIVYIIYIMIHSFKFHRKQLEIFTYDFMLCSIDIHMLL